MRTLTKLIIVVALFAAPGMLLAQDRPLLEVPVPGIELTPIIRDENYITVPWLAQYISGAYTFLISIAGLLAAVMMVVGGFQYLTSAGDSGRIGAAKKRMTNALMGLVLAFGSYAILYALNPDLIAFNGLKVATVATEVYGSDTIGDLSYEEIAQSSTFIPTPVPGKVPLYKQSANIYRAFDICLATSGCGPTSVSMVMGYYGSPASPVQVERALYDAKYYSCDNGSNSSGFTDPAVVGQFGFTGHRIKHTQAAVAAQLQKGRPVVVSVGPSIFTARGHYIVLTGIDAQGNVSVNDPGKSEYKEIFKTKRSVALHAKVPFKPGECPGGTYERNGQVLCVEKTIAPPIKPNAVPGSYVWPVLKSATVIIPASQTF